MTRMNRLKLLFPAAALAAFALAAASPACAAPTPEERLRYERALEQKTDEVLTALLGPGKCKVVIRAALESSPRESIRFEEEKPAARDEGTLFKWQNINRKPVEQEELLPGFTAAPAPRAPAAAPRHEAVIPQAAVKRLVVSLVLSETLSDDTVRNARQMVADMLALNLERGDELIITRVRFAPVWYNVETISALVRYAFLAVIALACVALLVFGFGRIADAIRSLVTGGNSIRVRMELEPAAEALFAGAALQAEAPAPLLPQPPEPPKPPEAPAEYKPGDGMIFNVKPDKLDVLVRMLAKDDPPDVALIAVHLPPALRPRFISMLPQETAPAVIAAIADIRFVDPDLIQKVKEELERRLDGAVGGYEKAVEMLQNSGARTRKAMLEGLEKTRPDVAAAMRERLLLLDDLERFSGQDLKTLCAAVPPETWAEAAWDIPEGARARLKENFAEAVWLKVQQALAGARPPEAKIEEAAAAAINAAMKLIAEGRIRRPAAKPAAIAAAPAEVKTEENSGGK